MKEQLLQKAKPILFNTEMVKAILDGRKTQTRRVIKNDYLGMADIEENNIYVPREDGGYINILNTTWSKYKVGDILYVRETWNYDDQDNKPYYRVDFDINSANALGMIWKPSIHMPKKYARIFLKVTNVRVERLQDVTREDVLKEGIKKGLLDMYKHYEISGNGFSDKDYYLNSKYVNGAICSFRTLWNSTAKDGYKWEDNPLVFVYEFEKVEVC